MLGTKGSMQETTKICFWDFRRFFYIVVCIIMYQFVIRLMLCDGEILMIACFCFVVCVTVLEAKGRYVCNGVMVDPCQHT